MSESPSEVVFSAPAQVSTKRLNRAAVLRALRELGAGSRGDIAERTGLSAATVSRVADDLIQARLLNVTGTISTRTLGRKSEVLKLNPRGGRILGIHLGGHSNDVGLADLSGQVYAEHHLPLVEEQRFEQVIDAVVREVERLLAEDKRNEPLLGIGVATGGVIDAPTGRLVSHGQFPWYDVALRDAVECRLGGFVAVGNSFQGLAWYESLFSGLDRPGSLLFVNCSTIIGAGFSTPNNITGSTTLVSGQLGHTKVGESDIPCHCGRKGCLQATASDPAISARAAEVFGPKEGPWDVFALGELAHAGEPRASAIFEERARLLIPAIAVLANTLAPSFLVLGHNKHAFANEEHQMMSSMLQEAFYPPLRGRIRVQPVGIPEPQRAVAAPLAIILREVYSPSLDLVRASRGRLVPELTSRPDAATFEEGQVPA